MPDLRPLLAPDSVVIIGAAADDSLRGRLTKQLVEHAYPGRVYPVTRSQKEVLGHPAYTTVAAAGRRTDFLAARLVHDKKTVQGKVHFVLPVRIGEVTVVSGIDEKPVLDAIRSALS